MIFHLDVSSEFLEENCRIEMDNETMLYHRGLEKIECNIVIRIPTTLRFYAYGLVVIGVTITAVQLR